MVLSLRTTVYLEIRISYETKTQDSTVPRVRVPIDKHHKRGSLKVFIHLDKRIVMNLDFYHMWVPSLAPKRWFIINLTLVLYSILQLIAIILSIHFTGERPDATATYLIWSFSTTVVWCVEAGLESWWAYMTASIDAILISPTSSPKLCWETFKSADYVTNVLELLLAVYYLIDSFWLLWLWKIKGDDIYSSLYDVLLNSVFYIYAMVRDFIRMRRLKINDDTNENESLSTGRMYIQLE